MAVFHYHDKFSDTMEVVSKLVLDLVTGPNRTILDIPAGSGRLSDRLREKGFQVVSADINGARENFVFADMNRTLPFADEQFDAVVSVEGIEHVLNYQVFINELARVTKPGGIVIITTPNISCFYSRFMFMCTGNFFQFWPGQSFVNVKNEEIFDYGHVTPLTWQKIYFHFAHHGFTLLALKGNKIKRKILIPIYLLAMLIGIPWMAYRLHYTRKAVQALYDQTDYYRNVEKFSYSLSAMFCRNVIMVLRKPENLGKKLIL